MGQDKQNTLKDYSSNLVQFCMQLYSIIIKCDGLLHFCDNIVTYSGFYSRRNFIALQKVNTLQLNTVRNSSNTRTRPTRTVSEH
jgi:hypothetical protein